MKPSFLKAASFCLAGSSSVAAAASGIADTLSILLFAAALAAGWFADTVHIRRMLPPRFFIFAAIFYLCFIPIDYFLLASDWQRVLLHAVWAVIAAKITTRADVKDWLPLYLLCAIQWIPAASQPTETIFWICVAAFIISGVSSLMLFELHYLLKIAAAKGIPEKSRESSFSVFPIRAFFITAAGVAVAVTTAAIPLFFFFPRLPAKNTAPPLSSDADSSFADSIEDIETLYLDGADSQRQPDAVVMRVKTDAPTEQLPYDLKWRGIAYDYYDGRAWTLRRREQQPIAAQGGFYKIEESAMGSKLLRQTFFMEETLTHTIFAAHRALAVSANAGFLRRDSSDNLSAWHPAQGRADYAEDYIVVSDTIHPSADIISDWTPIPDDISSTWLQLPDMDPRVVQLARDITGRYIRRYDKARALEIWLGSNYGYTETLPQNYESSEDGDPLAFFLFDTREGNCEYFATAMTVMLRSIGIPARITSGFQAGEYNPVSGSWTVRRKHSHVWTEAWFPPYGWIEFDATPMIDEFSEEQTLSRFFANLTDAAGLWWRENVAGYNAARQYRVISGFFTRVNRMEDRAGEFIHSSVNRARAVFDLFPQTSVSVKITASVFLFAAVSVIFLFCRTRRRRNGIFRRRKENPRTAAADFYAEALIFLKTRGVFPEKAQTPMEFAKSLDANYPAGALLDLTRFYNEARFSGTDAPFPRDKALSLLRSLKTTINHRRRQRLLTTRRHH